MPEKPAAIEPDETPIASISEISQQTPITTPSDTEIETPSSSHDTDDTDDNDINISVSDTDASNEAKYNEPEDKDIVKDPRHTNKRGILIWGGLILIVVLNAAALFYYLTYGSDDTSTATPVCTDSDLQHTSPTTNENTAISVTDREIALDSGIGLYTGSINADSLPDGHGSITYKGTAFESYTGDFVNGKMEGQGELISRNGNQLIGTFRNNLLVDGTYTIKKTGSYYVGTFINGEPYDGIWHDNTGKQTGSITAGKYTKTK